MFATREMSRGVCAGMRFGAWLVLGQPFRASINKVYSVVTKCDCGEIAVVYCGNLSRGRSTRCDKCSSRSHKGNRKHGGSRTLLYGVWKNMRKRCFNENHKSYMDYGGRGITVCDEWRSSWESFRDWAIENGYRQGLEIDRIDVNGNYEPSNCRWATIKTQARNRRSSSFVSAFGEEKCISEWAEDPRCVPRRDTLAARLHDGWDAERALTAPVRGKGGAARAY